MGRTRSSPCALDMTPMIDVTFQLIIFFIVTIKMEKDINPEIKLEYGKSGPMIKEMHPLTTVVEVDKSGHISLHSFRLGADQFKTLIKKKYDRVGSFPVLIRADKRTKHADIRRVMDICAAQGLWRIQFAAIKEKKAQD